MSFVIEFRIAERPTDTEGGAEGGAPGYKIGASERAC
jgi:hypothetical protein